MRLGALVQCSCAARGSSALSSAAASKLVEVFTGFAPPRVASRARKTEASLKMAITIFTF